MLKHSADEPKAEKDRSINCQGISGSDTNGPRLSIFSLKGCDSIAQPNALGGMRFLGQEPFNFKGVITPCGRNYCAASGLGSDVR